MQGDGIHDFYIITCHFRAKLGVSKVITVMKCDREEKHEVTATDLDNSWLGNLAIIHRKLLSKVEISKIDDPNLFFFYILIQLKRTVDCRKCGHSTNFHRFL